jgi:hypothetical protein
MIFSGPKSSTKDTRHNVYRQDTRSAPPIAQNVVCTHLSYNIKRKSGHVYGREVASVHQRQQRPAHIAQDYTEACQVLPISAKASAALARRCLQTILREYGYKARDLAQEIELALNEKDASKAMPMSLRDTIDGIRNFGNFSAHPITDLTTLQIIDVEPHEAEYCLEAIEEAFEHFYVRPAVVRKRRAELDAKLAAAGKPPSK